MKDQSDFNNRNISNLQLKLSEIQTNLNLTFLNHNNSFLCLLIYLRNNHNTLHSPHNANKENNLSMKNIKMAQNTKVLNSMEWEMDKVYSTIKMVVIMMAIGSTIICMDKVYIFL